MSNELKNELKVELSCGRCNFTKVIVIVLDEDGVFTIPNKFCHNDLSELSREVLRQFVSEPKPKPEVLVEVDNKGNITEIESKPDEPTENKTRVSDTLPRPVGAVGMSKHGANRSKKS